MEVIVSMLRGINLGPHHRVTMEALRALYTELKLRDPQTYIQSGNVVFRTGERDLLRLARKIEDRIERDFGFRADVVLRNCADMRATVAANPFAGRKDIEPGKLVVTFLKEAPAADRLEKLLALEMAPEELRIVGREMYIYYPNGQARPKVSWAVVDRCVGVSGTARNWNSVCKLLEMAERMARG